MARTIAAKRFDIVLAQEPLDAMFAARFACIAQIKKDPACSIDAVTRFA